MRSSASVSLLAERDRLILEQLPHVRLIAQKIHARLPHHIPLDDLVNTGVLGLMEALGKFDPRRKVELKSYASYRIRGAILDSLRDQDWGSRMLRHRGRQLEEAQQKLRGRLGRSPSQPELARELGISENGLRDLLNDLHGLTVTSLQAEKIGEGAKPAEEPAASDDESPFELCRQTEMNQLLSGAISRLSPRQQRMLDLYYFRGFKMKEVGAFLGVCESRISQMHADALASLRLRMKEQLRARRRSAPQLSPIAKSQALPALSGNLKFATRLAAQGRAARRGGRARRAACRPAAVSLTSRRAVA